jgi:hypothetical protein
MLTSSRLPRNAGNVFPVLRRSLPQSGTAHGTGQHAAMPEHVEDSWQPKDDMQLMKSAFRSQYMVMRGREAELPEESDRGRSEDLQEVQLEEYRSWSKGSWEQDPQNSRGEPPPDEDRPQAKDSGAAAEERGDATDSSKDALPMRCTLWARCSQSCTSGRC